MRSRPGWCFLLLLASCGSRAATEAVAAPVNAPLVARERLLHDLGGQQAAARQRAAGMAAVVDDGQAPPSDR